ncbi:Tropomyosin [Neolecta irregularis DAH-3]|uniref:Tropomyosin n=1 Tax=Neolecta irregularis (strain DAH-3) TaxID=1198029 RepID=A0A1U7LQ27_NEOID|nr:Tropomyosin [Neolecta irregularis DAH-3]|eukprot:OLL24765.1 Tropomyosin [Neolecta irregularis DAH-3]
MDKVREKLALLRVESDAASAKLEEAHTRIKQLEQESLQKEQEIQSLTHRNSLLEAEVEKLEQRVQDSKLAADDGDGQRNAAENLQRKVALLEEELEQNDKNLRETTEKLRQVDVKAEHFERKVATLEQERDLLERKLEEMTDNHAKAKRELEEVIGQLDNL